MSKTHYFDALRDDQETEIRVAFSATAGRPETGPSYACGGTPAEPGEIEIAGAWLQADDSLPVPPLIDLTDAEAERITKEIAESDDCGDDGPDPDDARDREMDR